MQCQHAHAKTQGGQQTGAYSALQSPTAPRPKAPRALLLVAAAQNKAAGAHSAVTTPSSSAKALARDVRAVPIRLVTVGKGNSPGAAAMAEEWLEKARRYTQVSEVVVKPNPKKAASVAVAVQAEGEKVLKALSPGEHVVLLDERGRDLSSEGMAKLIAAAGDTGASSLVFCIGGPFGHSNAVRARANDTVKLSSMVLNHQVAYIVLLEQIYRGWTILRGEPYHH